MQSLTIFALLLEIAPAIAGFSPFMRFERSGWAPAQQTVEARLEEGGISPVPTDAPRYPRFGAVPALDKRYVMGADTCGFDADYKSNAWTCFKNEASCATSGSYLGCCIGESPACLSTVLTSCIDFTNKPDNCGPQTLCCPSSQATCFTWLFKTSASPANTYSLFNCYSTLTDNKRTGKLVDAPPAETGKTSSKDLNPTSASSTSTTTSSKTSASASSSSSSSSSPTGVVDPPAAAQQAPAGAIVGGVVGGIAVLGMAAIAIFWFFVRGRKGAASPTTTTVASTAVPPGGPGVPSMAQSQSSPYYGASYHQDPNMQAYGAPYGYYPPEQKVPGQEGFVSHNGMATQHMGGAWQGHQQPAPVSELPVPAPQRHELS